MGFDPHSLTIRDLRLKAEKEGRRGYVGAGSADDAGQIHWTQAAVTPDRKWNQRVEGETLSVEQRMIASLHEGLPEVKRRSAEERFRVLFDRLVVQAMSSYRQHGYPVWPKSIQTKLTALGWKERDADVYGQCSALARQLFLEAGAKQKEKDQKKITLDWHGAYNHALATPSLDKPRPTTVGLVKE